MEKKDRKTVYWSSLSTFESCPKRFSWKYGVEGADFGAGPGNPKPILQRRSEHDAIMGSAIQSAIEIFYNQETWRKLVSDNVDNSIAREVAMELSAIVKNEFRRMAYDEEKYINWKKAPPYAEMEEICIDGVIGYIKTIIANYLIGGVNEAEKHVVVKNANNTGINVGAKMDVYLEKSPNSKHNPGITILDGKNSKSRGKYNSKDQLLLYALCVYLDSMKIPDRLGFVYYRFPFGRRISNVDVSKGVEWVKFDPKDMFGILDRIVLMRDKLYSPGFDFPATPSPNTCRFCDWQDQCEDRKIQIDINRGSRSNKFYFEGVETDSDGFQEISFDVNMVRGEKEPDDDDDSHYLVFLPEPEEGGFSSFGFNDGVLVGNSLEDKGAYKNK